MDRLLARLERRFGRFAIERLTNFIVGGMAIVFVLAYTKPEILGYLTLDPAHALREPWRFVTYFFIPTSMRLVWILFSLYWTWLVGTNLEHEWGAFKLNVYYLLGALATTAAAWITKEPQSNHWLITLSFPFAFATLFPNFEIRLYFLLPIRIKWLALLTLAYAGVRFAQGGAGVRVAIAAALANYLLFFAGHLIGLARGQQLQMRQAARRASFRPPPRHDASAASERACAICGARQDDGADIRVCSC